MTKSRKEVAVHIQSEVQFFSVDPLLKKMQEAGYSVTILVDDHSGDNPEAMDMATKIRSFLKKKGYDSSYFKDCLRRKFDLFLAPYVDGKIKAGCYLKYEYGTLNIKPNLTYLPVFMERIHGFLCQSTITANLLSVYGKTFLVDNLRFYNASASARFDGIKKKKVLFAPTFNDDVSDDSLKEVLNSLKKKYYVITKGHHGTEYLKKNHNQKLVLLEESDEYFGPETKLTDLILDVDVCVFGNSSAVAEALYVGKPCIVYSDDLDYFRLGDLHTTLYEMAANKQIITCNNPKDICVAVDDALDEKMVKIQKRLGEEILPRKYRNGVDGYLEVIDYFLTNPEAMDYVTFHDYVINEKYSIIKRYEDELKSIAGKCVEYEEKLDDFAQRKLYKIADKIYNIEGKIRNGKG
ncbi:MAG: CDP-glycerol glycerophosphotransferase family protein [Candidatus Saccharibacteria bacterium]|nr:CDP-glycerol glycerophosphotransferase family protein [Candidatus Saccharibacteria bacterium]